MDDQYIKFSVGTEIQQKQITDRTTRGSLNLGRSLFLETPSYEIK